MLPSARRASNSSAPKASASKVSPRRPPSRAFSHSFQWLAVVACTPATSLRWAATLSILRLKRGKLVNGRCAIRRLTAGVVGCRAPSAPMRWCAPTSNRAAVRGRNIGRGEMRCSSQRTPGTGTPSLKAWRRSAISGRQAGSLNRAAISPGTSPRRRA